MKDDDDKGKVIDITDYVHSKKTPEEIEIDNFTTNFLTILNQNLLDRQRKIARERFINFMINFLLIAQIATVIAICFIIAKVYS